MNRTLIFCLCLFSAVAFFACSKEYSLETGNSLTKAKGTLQDVSGSCLNPVIKGVYSPGVATKDSNYVQLQVNVTTAGNYTITTDTINGFSFKDAGNFTTTGLQTIKLKASGTPAVAQSTSFFVTFDSSVCSFVVPVNDTTGNTGSSVNRSDTAWTFSEGGNTFRGPIDTAFTFDTTVAGQSFKLMQIQGSTAATADSVFLLSVTFIGGNISTGSYSTASTSAFQFLGSYNISDTLYSATYVTPGVATVVKINSYDSNTRIIQGTFSGTAKNKSGTTVNISAGAFKAKLD